MARRSSSWTDEETKALISEWSKQEKLKSSTLNKQAYVNIATALKKQGFDRNWKKCRDQINNFKRKYKHGSKKAESGIFYQLDEILGPRPTKQPPYVSTTASDDTAKCSTSEDVICASDGEFVKLQNAFLSIFCLLLFT